MSRVTRISIFATLFVVSVVMVSLVVRSQLREERDVVSHAKIYSEADWSPTTLSDLWEHSDLILYCDILTADSFTVPIGSGSTIKTKHSLRVREVFKDSQRGTNGGRIIVERLVRLCHIIGFPNESASDLN
jgi:hypothetical protein